MLCTELSDKFILEGTDLKEFLDAVSELSTNTFTMPMATEQMELLPVVDADVLKNSFIPSLSFSGKITPSPDIVNKEIICLGRIQDFFSAELESLQAISLKQILEKGGSKDLFIESKEQSRLFIQYKKKFYFTSPKLAESLCARVKLYGDAIYDASVERTAFIARRLKNEPQTLTALIRTLPGSGIRKIMMLGSGHYQYIPQTIFKDVVNALQVMAKERPHCHSWQVNPFVTTVYLEFPDMGMQFQKEFQLPDHFTPGICITTSDTCDASLSAFPTWRIGDSIVEGPGILMEHNGKASVQAFHQKIAREILSQYPGFLKQMKHFQDLRIANPEEILSRLFVKLKIMKAVGKKRTLRLIPERSESFDGITYRAYDLIINLLQMPADCTLPESPAKKVRRAVYDAVFLEDKQYARR